MNKPRKIKRLEKLLLGVCFLPLFLSPAENYEKKAEKEIPCLDKFIELCQQYSEAGVNDCSNKSGRLARTLVNNGYHADIMRFHTKEWDPPHAIVVTKYKGEYFFLDPERKKSGSNFTDIYKEFGITKAQILPKKLWLENPLKGYR